MSSLAAVAGSSRDVWLRRVLVVKAVLCFVAWGLPLLFGTPALLAPFGVAVPSDPIFMRILGGVILAFGVAYWYASRDPLRNEAVVRTGVVDNGLTALIIVVVGLTAGVSSWFIWLTALVTAVFCVSFVVLMPGRDDGAK